MVVILANMSDIFYNINRCGGIYFMAKVGRHPVEDPKSHKVTIRMSGEEYQKLMEYNKTHSQTITETMSEAFNLLIEEKAKA